MKRLAFIAGSFIVASLGLFACGDANGQAQSQTVSLSQVKSENSAQAENKNPVVENVSNATSWTVDKIKSTLSFSGSQGGDAFTGVFEKFDAIINFDPDNLSGSNVVVTINMNTVDAGDAERTDALPGKEWFYTRKFPIAKFEAAKFVHMDGNKYEARGNLTIRDITQSIVLPFTLEIENDQASMDASLTIDRTDYKAGTGMWASEEWVKHDVGIRIHLEANK